MANCKCKSRPKIVSDMVRSCSSHDCKDVCTNAICGEPKVLSLMAPVIYDEIGINLCASFTLADIAGTYPAATNATVNMVSITPGTATLTRINGRPNCWSVTLSNITVEFAFNFYDDSCRFLGTISESAVYLPPLVTDPTYDADTNPTSVELEIFAPYGVAYDTTTTPGTPTPVINIIDFSQANNSLSQGVNLFAIGKLLDLDIATNSVTVGLTLVIQSLYYSGYKVNSAGKIDIPKGSILSADNSDCMRFVAGDLLDLAIKPLDLGAPAYEECLKNDCNPNTSRCGGDCINNLTTICKNTCSSCNSSDSLYNTTYSSCNNTSSLYNNTCNSCNNTCNSCGEYENSSSGSN